jgi:DNA-binding PadR family transcriptional regulator
VAVEVSKVEVVVLGLLAKERLYGYELLERLRDRSLGFWVEVGRASVYQALRRLENEGLITGKAQDGTDGPDRRVFRITRAGRDRLRTGLAERLAGSAAYDAESHVALGFSSLMSAEEAKRGMTARQQALADLRARIEAERARLAGTGRGGDRTVATRMLDLQDALAAAESSWLASFRKDMARLRR